MWKSVERSLWVMEDKLPQAEFKYLGILFTSDGKVKRELDCWTGVMSE